MPEDYKISLIPPQYTKEAVQQRNRDAAKERAASEQEILVKWNLEHPNNKIYKMSDFNKIQKSQKWLDANPESDSDEAYTILERGKHKAIVEGRDPSYYEQMINDGKQFTKGALGVLSLPYLGAAAAGTYGYGASLGARGLFAGQGIYGLANKNGVRKTANLIKSREYGKAALSGVGDVLNTTMIIPAGRLLGNIAKYGLKSTYVADRLTNNIRNAPQIGGRLIVNSNYFNDPTQFYRIGTSPEKLSMEYSGKNIVSGSAESLGQITPADAFRRAISENSRIQPGKGIDEGYWILTPEQNETRLSNLLQKTNSSHGNRTQASSGMVWKGGLNSDSRFPSIIFEGAIPENIGASWDPILRKKLNRSTFITQPSENLPKGTRLGFKTGEMPIESTSSFSETTPGSGKFFYNGQIVPENRTIGTYHPSLLKGKTSYALFERPSKLSEVERLGIPKGERNSEWQIFDKSKFSENNPKFLAEGSENTVIDNGSSVLKQSYGNAKGKTIEDARKIAEAYKAHMNASYNQMPIKIAGYTFDGKYYTPVYKQLKVKPLTSDENLLSYDKLKEMIGSDPEMYLKSALKSNSTFIKPYDLKSSNFGEHNGKFWGIDTPLFKQGGILKRVEKAQGGEKIDRHGNEVLEEYKDTKHDPLKDNWDSTAQGSADFLSRRKLVKNTEVPEWFKSYVNSPGYDRISKNQSEWWLTRHPYRRIFDFGEHKLGATSYKDAVNNTNPRLFNFSSYTGLGFYSPTTDNAYSATIPNSEKYPNVIYQFTKDWEDAHELNHQYQYHGRWNQGAQREAIGIRKYFDTGDEDANRHDMKFIELHSDTQALKYMLYKEGIYDVRGDRDATSEDIRRLREKYPNLRILQQLSDEEAAWQINHVAQVNDNKPLPVLAKSGIKIKPENKGKFTETKKRTGKSTEELTHSKNPVTRKRAIFAQNAKKWNKK